MLLAVILIIVAALLWLLARQAGRAAGLPVAEVVYADTARWGRLERPLYSQPLGLTGKPDYIVRDGPGYVPVEVKAGPAPGAEPHASHLYQLAAYCALVAEAFGHRPDYGLLKYDDRTFRVEFTAALESELLELMDRLRADRAAADVARSHSSAARCRACGMRQACDQALEA